MSFSYQSQNLFWQKADLSKITSQIEQTFLNEYDYQGAYYLYHAEVLHERLNYLSQNLPAQFYFSVKSLSNIHILQLIRSYSSFGVDVVSNGELQRSLQAGFLPSQIVFAGVGKTSQEIERALQLSIQSFHVESVSELKKIAQIAQKLNLPANIALRLNPNIMVDTHHYITTGKEEDKFGIDKTEVSSALSILKNNPLLQLKGLQAHIGSQIKELQPYLALLDFLTKFAQEINTQGFAIDSLSLGGGFGVDYESSENTQKNLRDEFPIAELASKIKNHPFQIFFEPGRFVSAYSGILVSHLLYLKERAHTNIAVTDAGMNDFMRVALYQAQHPILPLQKREGSFQYDIVGPVCESGDFFAKGLSLSKLEEGDILFLLHVGAYGSTMSSRYNSRRLLPEVLIDSKENFHIIRKPEQWDFILETEVNI